MILRLHEEVIIFTFQTVDFGDRIEELRDK